MVTAFAHSTRACDGSRISVARLPAFSVTRIRQRLAAAHRFAVADGAALVHTRGAPRTPRPSMTRTLPTPPKGFAAVAMLKAYLDNGIDHLDMFMPFVIDTLTTMQRDDMSVGELREALYAAHGLGIPDHVLYTLLKRSTKKGYTRREAGRFHRNRDRLPTSDIRQRRADYERQQHALAESLASFATSSGLAELSTDDALSLLVRFIDENHLSLIAAGEITDGQPGPRLDRKHRLIIARYLRDIVPSDHHLSSYIKTLLEGFVLHNTLLLNDLAHVDKKLSTLTVYLDTKLILRTIGMFGSAAQLVAQDFLETLRANEARLCVFDITLEEVASVLRVYEKHLATRGGVRSLRPTQLTRHLASQRMTSSDITVIIATLRTSVSSLGILVHSLPPRVASHVLDEADLARRFQRDNADIDVWEPRITHDVNVIASILTLRGGHSPSSLAQAKAIFVTETSLVVQKTNEWYREQRGIGLSPVAMEHALANAAWLLRPASAAKNMKLHQLAALCSAALQPSAAVWQSFIREIEKLESSGRITSDQAALGVIAALTDERILADVEERDLDADTVAEIIERVKDALVVEHREREKAYVVEHHEREKAYIVELNAAKSSQELAMAKLAQLEARTAALFRAEQDEAAEFRARTEARFRAISRWASRAVFGAIIGVLAVGCYFTLPGTVPEQHWARPIISGLILLFVIIGFVDLVWGTHLLHWAPKLESRLYRRLLQGIEVGARRR